MRIAPYIVAFLNLSRVEQSKFLSSLTNQESFTIPKEVKSVPFLKSGEAEIQGLPTEPNVPPDASYTFNAELNKPTSDREESRQ